MNEVLDFLKKCEAYFLATDDNGQPRVRPFGTIDLFEDALYIQTGKIKEVSKQIHKNPNIEICAFDGNKWLRLSAKAIEDDRLEAKVHMLEAYPSLQNMYKADDGNTEVFKLTKVRAIFSSFIEPSRIIEWE